MYWKKTDAWKSCNDVVLFGKKLVNIGEDWELNTLYFNDAVPNEEVDEVTITLKKKEESNG